MNIRQFNKHLKKSLYHDEELKGRKIYSYKFAHNDNITLVFTAKPKQKGCSSYSESFITEELRLYGYKAAYEYITVF